MPSTWTRLRIPVELLLADFERIVVLVEIGICVEVERLLRELDACSKE
jgi:hypothetical protein